ncbi:uncharacterized protein WM277_022052 isoform 2-T2 [Molossus nigricans]
MLGCARAWTEPLVGPPSPRAVVEPSQSPAPTGVASRGPAPRCPARTRSLEGMGLPLPRRRVTRKQEVTLLSGPGAICAATPMAQVPSRRQSISVLPDSVQQVSFTGALKAGTHFLLGESRPLSPRSQVFVEAKVQSLQDLAETSSSLEVDFQSRWRRR